MKTDKMDIVVVNGVITRRGIVEELPAIFGEGNILFLANKEQIIHYLRVQDESNNID